MAFETPDTELIYVGDPMCSWCWGIAPELDAVIASRPDLPFRIVLGGLRPGPSAQTVGPEFAASLAHHWDEVEARSDQPFDRTLLDRHDWTYDTEPACRAVVVMRELAPHETFPFFKHLQHAFYAEGRAVWDPSTYPELIAEFDVDGEAFMEVFDSDRAVKATWKDFSLARSWGIAGFPTIVFRTGTSGHIVTRGYTTAETMESALSSFV